MNSSWGSNTNITFQVCHARIWEADTECILKKTAFSLSCGQVFHNDRHHNCSRESFQCMKWTQVQVLSKMYYSKSVMNVDDRLMQKLCRYWQHSHWVVVNFSVMTGTNTEVLSHFNAYSCGQMNTSSGSNTNVSFKVCQASIWEADAEVMQI